MIYSFLRMPRRIRRLGVCAWAGFGLSNLPLRVELVITIMMAPDHSKRPFSKLACLSLYAVFRGDPELQSGECSDWSIKNTHTHIWTIHCLLHGPGGLSINSFKRTCTQLYQAIPLCLKETSMVYVPVVSLNQDVGSRENL